MNYVSLLTIAIAVSLDSFGVGVAYGVRHIRVPVSSLAIITFCTAVTLGLSVFASEIISAALSPELTQTLGGVLLVGIGLVAILNQLRSQMRSSQTAHGLKEPAPDPLVQAEDSPTSRHGFQTIAKRLQRPNAVNVDRAKSISSQGALLLGLAVSLDSFVAGIGIRLMGYSPWLIIFTLATMSSAFIYLGIRTGLLIADRQWFRQLPYFPGTMLIVIGLHRVL
ncbi:sporulation membrane protein YtaF [Nodosilinea sp. E11]|uniref:sporulation membrane protein YtaF n=1 Tax=Nodosilinea sp. E11 TaxID=3037479 RepID=UPI00293470B6|nr:sporulation membrane protein YtaF [Nodosilinea sp. E11]WOD38220.1 sporulation membrane protein YtaF [Nodosilinea sp. E11]